VSRLTNELDKEFVVIRANIGSELGMNIRESLDVRLVPTFMVLNTSGQEIWRSSVMVPAVETILSLEYN